MKLAIMNANAFKVKIQDGTDAYVEDHDHCALISTDRYNGFVAGQYYFPNENTTEFVFMVWDEDCLPQKYNCKILEYSHDYGKHWEKVK